MLSPSPYLGAPNATAGQAQGPEGTIDTEGAGQPPEAPTVMTGASSTRLTSTLLRQGPVPHLSKSEASRLADWGALP